MADYILNNRYRLLAQVASGGMAVVYKAHDLILNRVVAVKILRENFADDSGFRARFQSEAQAAANLAHPNIVTVYDYGQDGTRSYIVMEFVEGRDLKSVIRAEAPLPMDRAIDLMAQACAALGYAHRAGLVHCDVKPQNLIVTPDGRLKVTDFGIARAGDSGMTEAGSILGTAQYLAPEQAQGQPVDMRSDLYSVGIVLYEMLTGTVPFKGDSAVTVALKHVNEIAPEPSQLVPGMPYALNQIVLKAMAKAPADRYQSAAQFSRDLRSAQIGGPIAAAAFDPSAERTSLMTAPAGATAVMAQAPLDQTTSDRRRKRRRWPGVLLVVLLLLVIAAAAYGLIRAMGGGSVTVPPVVGLSQASAERALAKQGFKTGLQEEYSDTVAKGFVSRQAPSGGTKMRKGETVDIWVSKGSETVTLSDFTGWTPKKVEAWLTQNDLVGARKSGKNSVVASGRVYRQDPRANSDVKRGDTVTYWVSSGKPVAGVPNLSGLSQSDAQAALVGAGLVLGVVTSQTSTTVSSGLVISQDPVAGTQVDKGSAVNIVLSSGSPSPSPSPTATVAVPNVYGMNSALAAQKISDVGLAVAIKEKGGTGQPPGTVVKIVPDAGVMVPLGSTVLLVIAK